MTKGDTTILERMNGTFVFFAGMRKGFLDLRASSLVHAVENLQKFGGLRATHWIPKYGKKQEIPGVILDLVPINQS